MEVKPGFKTTEVGVIPKDWECVQICRFAKLESGHTPSKLIPAYWDGGIPWVSLNDTEILNDPQIFRTDSGALQRVSTFSQ